MQEIDTNKPYIQYCYDVLNGNIVASENIKLACERTLSWFNRDDIYFDTADVDRKIRFISKLKHSTGQHAGKNFELLAWQQWVVANIFGWKWNDTGYRVTKKALLFMSRKSGKTAFAAALALAHTLVDNEPNAEVELVANSRQQANIALEHCQNLSESVDPRKKIFKRYRGYIKIPVTKSSIQVLASDAMGNDGYNSSMFILDEFHAQSSWDLYNVMISSQGMRTQPLAIVITTAGFLGAGFPLYDMRQTCIDILKGNKYDDTQFSALYELDEDDDWTDENVWQKSCPSLGHTVLRSYLKEQVQAALNMPSLQVGVITKNFNRFVSSEECWIDDEFVNNSMKKVDLSRFIEDEPCYAGVDLSSRGDLTAWSVMFPPNDDRDYYPDKYVFKTFIYIPEHTMNKSINSGFYQEHYRNGYVKMTSGNTIDYDEILKDQLEFNAEHFIQTIAYDAWNSAAWANNATANALPIEPYSQTLGSFNRPTKEFERLLLSGKIIIDYNPVVRWMFSNAEIKYDSNGNIKPIKSGSSSNKIDGIISMLESLGTYLLQQPTQTGEILFA